MRKSLKTAFLMASFVCVFCFGFFFAGCGCDSNCKVTLDPQGGTGLADNQKEIIVAQGKSFTEDNKKLPTNVTMEGYLFDGWYDKATEGTKYTNSSKVNADVKLYAHWVDSGIITEITTYLITFKNGDNVISTQEVAQGGVVSKPADPETPSGQTFVGWYNGNTEFDFNTQPTANLELTPKFVETAEAEYTITYDLNLPAGVSNADVEPADLYGQSEKYSQKVKGDWKFIAPTKPELAGYTFNGWFKEAAGTEEVTANTTFSANTTVYAKWTKGYNAVDDETNPYFVFQDAQGKVLTGLTTLGREQNELVIPDGVETILKSFGAGTTWQNLVKLTIPDSVKVIHEGAFKNMYALWIVIDNTTDLKNERNTAINLKDPDTAAKYFANGENVENMYIGAANTNVKVETSNGIVHYINNTKGAGYDYAATVAKANKSNTTMDLSSETFTHITGYAFYRCSSLTSITLPKTLEQIYFRAFFKCSALTTVTFDGADKNLSNMRVIGKAAFRATSVNNITIPAGVSDIYLHAFYEDTALTSVTFVNTNNWYVGSTKLSATNMANTATAAKYLTKTYVGKDKINSFVVGDITADGLVDENDFNELQSILGSSATLSDDQKVRADINVDGDVGVLDLKILRLIVAKELPIPCPAKTLSTDSSKGGKLDIDATGDSKGRLDAADQTAIETAHQNIAELSAAEKDKYDVNGDGVFNAKDVQIVQALVSIIVSI